MQRDPASAPTATAVQVFDILARQNAQMLTAFLRSLVFDSHAVDDLFQETMLVAWRRLPDYDHALPFGPWLRGIAGKLVLEHRRKSAARGALRCEPEALEALETEFERFEHEPADSFRRRLESLSRCVEKLPPLMRDTVSLLYTRGLWLEALAAALDAGLEAVKKRVRRARQLLADCLEGVAHE